MLALEEGGEVKKRQLRRGGGMWGCSCPPPPPPPGEMNVENQQFLVLGVGVGVEGRGRGGNGSGETKKKEYWSFERTKKPSIHFLLFFWKKKIIWQ